LGAWPPPTFPAGNIRIRIIALNHGLRREASGGVESKAENTSGYEMREREAFQNVFDAIVNEAEHF